MDSGHLLALKVMRLTRPTLVSEAPVVKFDDNDLLGRHDSDFQSEKKAFGVDEHGIRLTGMLSLPQNFGNIYLGETFTAYVSVHNDSNFLCRDIIVKADLQTNSSKVSMTAAPMEPVSELPPDRSIDQVLTHEVKELGAHILVCTVSYTASDGEKQYFKKYFKFQVQRPLDVKTDFRATESDEIFLEARIQNITTGPIFLEKVYLEPFSDVQLLSTPDTDMLENREPPLIPNCLREMEIRQFLYLLKPSSSVSTESLEGSFTVGKLDITWRSLMGQKARLQTSPLSTTLPPPEDIRVSVEQVPASVKLDAVFDLVCRITNHSKRKLELRMSTRSAAGALQLCGFVSRSLPSLPPGCSERLDLQVLALLPGLHSVSGLVLTDCLINRAYEFHDLVQVLVQP